MENSRSLLFSLSFAATTWVYNDGPAIEVKLSAYLRGDSQKNEQQFIFETGAYSGQAGINQAMPNLWLWAEKDKSYCWLTQKSCPTNSWPEVCKIYGGKQWKEQPASIFQLYLMEELSIAKITRDSCVFFLPALARLSAIPDGPRRRQSSLSRNICPNVSEHCACWRQL